jgi:hypothetical protein
LLDLNERAQSQKKNTGCSICLIIYKNNCTW